MVTVVVGKKNNQDTCKVLTSAEEFADSKYVEFELQADRKNLKPSDPRWANYVKGVVAHYKGIY